MSDQKESPPSGVKPSSSQPISTSSSSDSKENLTENLLDNLLPEILVTEEKEESSTEISRKRPELLIQDTTKTPPPSTAPSLSLDSFTFSPVKSDDKQLKAPGLAPFLSSSSEEALFKEGLEDIRKITSGLGLPFLLGYSDDSSSSSGFIPIPLSVPPKELEGKLLLVHASRSVHRATQTSWLENDSDLSSTENITSSTTVVTKKNNSAVRSWDQASCSPEKQADMYIKGTRNPSPTRTYQTVFRIILQELLERELQEADIDVAPSARLKQDTRMRLAHMFKTNFERYKDVFNRIVNRRKTTITINSDIANWKYMAKYLIIPTPSETSSSIPSIEDLLIIDEGWLEEIAKVHRGIGLPTFYKDIEGYV
ncbi:glutamate-rich protein 6B isoform X2 [Monodelphis domestica]|uniref:glutamate-rich protein 6B isoform X2 n=1 Tax=Monodelphis domestica TaxID=13616 RepID=UPI0024E265BF|nr:glutamate-rich protein 6B isoform X2 [Monodelphis domestica]